MDGLIVGKIVALAGGGKNKKKNRNEQYADPMNSTNSMNSTRQMGQMRQMGNTSSSQQGGYGQLGQGVAGGTYGSMITPTTKEDEEGSALDVFNTIVKWIVAIAISSLAAFLSWNCNTYQGTSMPIKIVYAVLSFIFGWIYLILYVLFFRLECHTAKVQSDGGRRLIGGRK